MIIRYGMPFGASAANCAWHRIGSLSRHVIRNGVFAPIARFVDDYFGTTVEVFHWSGARCVSVLLALMGFACDEMKDVDDAMCLDVLGHTVVLDCASLSVEIQVQKLEANAWTSSLRVIISESFVGADLSLKMAGRLGSTVSVNPDRTGRAYVKPFFAQAYAPLRFASAHLLRACYWWIEYLNERPL